MYRELHPLRQTLATEVSATLPRLPGVEPDKLLASYLDRLTLYIGLDVADASFTALALDAGREVWGDLRACPNRQAGFVRFQNWVEGLQAQFNLRLVTVAAETTGVYYWALWDYLAEASPFARVLFNPRTTQPMGEVLSVKVRDDLVDALLIAEQLRLGSTPEGQLCQDADLLSARLCSRAARDLASQINRKKCQLRAYLRAYSPAVNHTFPKAKLHHPAVAALLKQYLFADEFIAAGEATLTQLLTDHCRSAFGQADAQRLLAESRHVIARPIQPQVFRCRVHYLLDDLHPLHQQQQHFLKLGYGLIKKRPETALVKAIPGAGVSNTLALISELTDVVRFPSGAHLASFLGLTTSKHISGTSLYQAKHITKQGSPHARYAAVNLAGFLGRRVPRYQQMYQTIKARKPPRKGHFVALVAVARDFVTNVLYDMLLNQRPFFVEVEDYRKYRQQHQTVSPPADPVQPDQLA
jgi:transposase